MNHPREPRAKARGVGCCANPAADVLRTRHKTPVKTVRRYEDVDRSKRTFVRVARAGSWPRRPVGAAVRSSLRWARPAVAAAALAVVIWRLGSGPFLDGVRALDGRALLAGAAIFLLTTVCCAWRWTIVARGLGVRLSLPAAVAAYYRCLFLNLTLPGGVAGDVHRGVSHGRDVHDIGLALRAVVWERTAGQVVQVVLTISVLFVLPSPVRSSMPLVAVALVATAVGVVLVDRVRNGRRAFQVGAGAERGGGRHPWRSASSKRVAGGRACVDRGRPRLRGHVPDRRADDRGHRAGLPAPAAGVARDAGHGAAEHRRLGAAGGRHRMGVLRGRPGRGSWRRDRRRLRSHGARRQPPRRPRARCGMDPPAAVAEASGTTPSISTLDG